MPAKIARLGTELPHPVTHISKQAMTERLALSNREQLVQSRKRLIQSVRSIVKSLVCRIDSCSAVRFPAVVRDALGTEEGAQLVIGPMLIAIEGISVSIRQLDEQIDRSHPVTRQLRQITGVGPLTTLAFVLAVEDPLRI